MMTVKYIIHISALFTAAGLIFAIDSEVSSDGIQEVVEKDFAAGIDLLSKDEDAHSNVLAEGETQTSDMEKDSDPGNASSIVTNATDTSQTTENMKTELDAPANVDAPTENGTAKVNGTRARVTCRLRNVTDVDSQMVEIVNGSTLLNVVQKKSNASDAECILVLFYAPWCQFSANAAPHYNALPRLFTNLSCLAVNAIAHSSLNTRFGIVAVPTLLLFHNAHTVAKFNDTQYTLEKFVAFIEKFTGLQPQGSINITTSDLDGPLPSSPTQETDYQLWMSWAFIILCCIYGFSKSSLCQQIIETIHNNWREAEAQHEHAE